jgi:protein SCO1/2
VSKKALLALCVAILVPLAFFSVTNYKSKNAVIMPRRYFYDSVVTTMRDGKEFTDTLWHRVENISLVNQLGHPVSLGDLGKRVIVADFFFTHCPSICPYLTRNMKKMQDAITTTEGARKPDSSFVQFLSFTVDPERDSAAALKKYADKYGVNPDMWWLLTGPKKTIYDFALQELKLGIADGEGVDSNFIHTQKMVLLDKEHVVRGYYDGLDSADLSKLAKDIVLIMLEKDKSTPSAIQELRPLLPMFVLVLVGTALAVYLLTRPSRKLPVTSDKKNL